MVIIHIANIDTSIVGGVQVAVPQMVRSQSKFATVGLINIHGDHIEDVHLLPYCKEFCVKNFSAPFNSPDLVIFHEVYRFDYISIYKSLIDLGIPYIIIPHGCLSKQAQKKKFLKKFSANLLYFNKFIRNACYLQYLTENEKCMSSFRSCPAIVSGNGVVLRQKRKCSFSANGLKLVYIGRLEIRIKGIDLLLAAIARCKELMSQNEIRVALYGPDYNSVHDCIRRLINKYSVSDLVSIGEGKFGKEKEEILLSSDCFIQTSRSEGLPMGVLEALCYGLPCIVTEGVGLGGSIERHCAGFHCDTSVDGIADAINRLVKERSRVEDMSVAAIKLVCDCYDTDLVAKSAIHLYSQIIQDESLMKG